MRKDAGQVRPGCTFSCTIITVVYTTLFALWYGAFFLPWGNEWPLEGTAIIGSWFYLPMWILLGWALLRRQPRAVLILCLPLFCFVLDYGHLFLPRWPTLQAADKPALTIRVMSWNAYYRNRDGDAFNQAMQEIQPDIVAIQELGFGLEQPVIMQLGEQFPYQELYPTGGPSGMALLSRYPILMATLPDFRSVGGCNCQEITIDVNGQPVTVINTHPWPPHIHFHSGNFWASLADFTTANQNETFDGILARIDAASTPLLLLGDLNTSERQYNYRRLRAVLTDAFAEAGWGIGYTFPTVKRVYGIPVFPVLRLDYIFHDEQWRTQRIWRGTIPGSDHRYIAADLVLGVGE